MEQDYEVFISCKSQDYKYGQIVYDFLSSCGIKTFFAPVTLGETGNADYSLTIGNAIDKSTHFIVVASNSDYITTPWVQNEWSTFLNEKNSGRKSGNLLTVLKDIDPGSLYIYLRNVQSFNIDTFKDSILDFLPLGREIVKPQIIEENSDSASPRLEDSQVTYEQQQIEQWIDLGSAYEYGNGVKQNYEEAYQWYLKAAKKNHPFGLFKQAFFICNGLGGVEKSPETAYKLFKKSGDLGFGHSYYNMGIMYLQGDGVRQSQARATAYFEKGAELNDAECLFEVAERKEDIHEALPLYVKAYDQGSIIAAETIGNIYESGEEVKADAKNALRWYKRAAKKGLTSSMISAGILLADGVGKVEQDLLQALKWYEKAIESGDNNALVWIGKLYMKEGTEYYDPNKAIEYFQLAAEENDADALYELARCYQEGVVFKIDLDKAKELYSKAEELGSEQAKKHLLSLSGNNKDNFVTMIDDVFRITGRGTVVTGQLTSKISVGDAINIVNDGQIVIDSVVLGVEIYRKIVDEGKPGDNVGLILREVKSNKIKRGMMIYKK